MAILKHIAVKNSNYGQMQRYLLFQHDEQKQTPILNANGEMILRKGYIMDALNCDPFTFNTECAELNRKWGKNLRKEERKAHHYIISFDPRDVPEHGLTPETVQSIGIEFANHYFSGHQTLIVTHMDGHNHSGNLHCHIVLNSLRKVDVPWQDFMEEPIDAKAGFKHHPTDKLIMHMYRHLQTICEREHLHIVDLSLPTDRRVTDAEYRKSQRGQRQMDERNEHIREEGYEPIQTKYSTIKENIRRAVDEAVELAQNEQDFVRIMHEQFDIAVRVSRGVISYKHPDREKPIRGRSLGSRYEREQIVDHIVGHADQEDERRKPEFKDMPRIFFIHSELRLVVDLQNYAKAQISRAYARKVALTNLQEMARTIAFIQEQGIGTLDKLADATASVEGQYSMTSGALRETQNAINALNEKIHYMGIYLSYKSIHAQLLSHTHNDEFQAAHQKEINAYKTAVQRLESLYPGEAFPALKELKEGKACLVRQKKEQMKLLHSMRALRKQMRVVGLNVEEILQGGQLERRWKGRIQNQAT